MVQRLREAVDAAGGPTKVSAKSGVVLRTLTHYLAGVYEMKAAALVRLARATDVRAEWLATGEGQRQLLPVFGPNDAADLLSRVETSTAVPVTYYDGARLAAGGGALIEAESMRTVIFDAAMVHRDFGVAARELAIIPVHGESMEPTIRSGELVLLDMSERGRALSSAI